MNPVIKILEDAVRRYYSSHWIEAPPSVEMREFGVGEYGRKIATRHLSFPSEEEMNRFLRERTPFYISYSVGYFKFPRATPMENKILVGSDLIFEFDADEVGLYSDRDVWICKNCGASGYGYVEKCPKCGGPVEMKLFPDPEREEKLKERVDTLIKDFLLGDLGLSKDEISVNFSGNRGYHVHVRSKELYSIVTSKEVRVELMEYITGQSIDPGYIFGESVSCGPIRCVRGPSTNSRGWPGRIARSVVRVLREGRREVFSSLKKKAVDALFAHRDQYINYISRGLWPAPKLFPLQVWIDVARSLTPTMGHTIDTQTSADIYRLIRLPDTIHGTTGLIAKKIRNLKSFDPYRDAVVLPSKEITVRVRIAPEFEMKGKRFGPFKNEEVQLPLYVAHYLIGRGVAEWTLASTE